MWRERKPVARLFAMPEDCSWCCLRSLKKLAISSTKLNSMLPFGSIPSLESLEVDFQLMGRLPQGIGRLSNLRKLHLKGKMATLPKTLYRLTKLIDLTLESGRLKAIPKEIALLSELRRFNLHAPWVRSLPKSLWNLEHLQHLTAGNSLDPYFKMAAPPDDSCEDHCCSLHDACYICGHQKKKGAAAAAKEVKLDANHGKDPYRGPWHQMLSLEIVGYYEASLQDASHRLRNLRRMKLSNCKRLEYMMSLQMLTCLEELSLHNMPHLQILSPGVLGSPTLKKLTIDNFRDAYHKGLNSRWRGDWLKMTSLTSLYISAFDGIKELPPSLSQLPALEEVYLGGMPELVLSAELFPSRACARLPLRTFRASRPCRKGSTGQPWSISRSLSLELGGT